MLSIFVDTLSWEIFAGAKFHGFALHAAQKKLCSWDTTVQRNHALHEFLELAFSHTVDFRLVVQMQVQNAKSLNHSPLIALSAIALIYGFAARQPT